MILSPIVCKTATASLAIFRYYFNVCVGDDNMISRRQFITGFTTASTVIIAGCSGDSSSGPEDVAEQFFIAVTNGDQESANEVLHPESDWRNLEGDFGFRHDNESVEWSINSIETKSLRELIEEDADEQVSDEEINTLINSYYRDLEENNPGVEVGNIAFVTINFEYKENSETEEGEYRYTVIQQEGEWYMYPDFEITHVPRL